MTAFGIFSVDFHPLAKKREIPNQSLINHNSVLYDDISTIARESKDGDL